MTAPMTAPMTTPMTTPTVTSPIWVADLVGIVLRSGTPATDCANAFLLATRKKQVDAIVTHAVGGASTDPWFALWRAILVTSMTTGVAYVLLVCARRL